MRLSTDFCAFLGTFLSLLLMSKHTLVRGQAVTCGSACFVPSDCFAATGGCTACVSLDGSSTQCVQPVCGDLCFNDVGEPSDDFCKGNTEGCTYCDPDTNVCVPRPKCNDPCSGELGCLGATDGCTRCDLGLKKCVPATCGDSCYDKIAGGGDERICAGATETDGCTKCVEPDDNPNNYFCQASPSQSPSALPSVAPSIFPSVSPSKQPSVFPSTVPSVAPSIFPSVSPSKQPSVNPSTVPSKKPSRKPSKRPINQPFKSKGKKKTKKTKKGTKKAKMPTVPKKARKAKK